MTEVEIINEQLKKFGHGSLNEPLYRIVWSDGEIELRRGTFRDYAGNLFIREVTETRWTKKYNYISERWIMERLIPPEVCYNPELPGSQFGSYEPIYVFQDKNGKFLPLNARVAEFLVNLAEKRTKLTEQELINEELEKEDEEVKYYMDYLEVSPITNALHLREAVGYSVGLKERKEN